MPHITNGKRRRPRPAATPLAYRVSDVVALVGISDSGIRQLIKDGRLRAVRHGRLVLVPAAEVRRLVDPEAA